MHVDISTESCFALFSLEPLHTGSGAGACATCEQTIVALDTLLNQLVMLCIVIAIVAGLHLLYIARMRWVYRHLLHANYRHLPHSPLIEPRTPEPTLAEAAPADGLVRTPSAALLRARQARLQSRLELSQDSPVSVPSSVHSPPPSPPSTLPIQSLSARWRESLDPRTPRPGASPIAAGVGTPEGLEEASHADVTLHDVTLTAPFNSAAGNLSSVRNSSPIKTSAAAEKLMPYAIMLIWPNPEVFFLILYAPLLSGQSVAALSIGHVTGCCTHWRCWLPWVVLGTLLLFLARTARLLWRFQRSHTGKILFQATVPPAAPKATTDPLFRGLNYLRAAFGFRLTQRSRGEYHLKPLVSAEPETTLRILRHPFGHWGFDFEEQQLGGTRSLFFVWIGASHGGAPWFVFQTLMLNLVLFMIFASSALEVGYAGYWRVQRVAVLVLFVLAVLLSRTWPSTTDRLYGWVVTALYALHALAAFFAMAGHDLEAFPLTESLQMSTGLKALSSYVPVSLMVYQLIFVPTLANLRTHGFSHRLITHAIDHLVLMVRTLFATLSGTKWWLTACVSSRATGKTTSRLRVGALSPRAPGTPDKKAQGAAESSATNQVPWHTEQDAPDAMGFNKKSVRALISTLMGGPPLVSRLAVRRTTSSEVRKASELKASGLTRYKQRRFSSLSKRPNYVTEARSVNVADVSASADVELDFDTA